MEKGVMYIVFWERCSENCAITPFPINHLRYISPKTPCTLTFHHTPFTLHLSQNTKYITPFPMHHVVNTIPKLPFVMYTVLCEQINVYCVWEIV
jgi:hypothetical protein